MSNNIQNITKYPKSSFYWGIRILDINRRNAMFSLYAFCKRVDSIGDSELSKKRKKKKINELKKEVNQIFENKSKNNSGKVLKNYIDLYKLKKKHFLDIINGVEMDIDNIMVCPNMKIFNLYCYRVAGAVGLISLKIFGDYNANTKSFGLYLANALQITNILRDIKQDKAMNRMYIPKEILNSVGIKNNNIISILKNKNFPKACLKLAKLADLNFKYADKKLQSCSKKKLKSAVLMMNTYKLLLNKLKKKGWDNLEEKVNLTKLEKIIIFVKGMIY